MAPVVIITVCPLNDVTLGSLAGTDLNRPGVRVSRNDTTLAKATTGLRNPSLGTLDTLSWLVPTRRSDRSQFRQCAVSHARIVEVLGFRRFDHERVLEDYEASE
jgi:hypothetical protein